MRKLLLSLTILLTAVGFTSCDENRTEVLSISDEAIVLFGRWQQDDGEKYEIYTFNSDGTGSLSTSVIRNSKTGPVVEEFQFGATSNELKIKYDNRTVTFSYAIEGTQLSLSDKEGNIVCFDRPQTGSTSNGEESGDIHLWGTWNGHNVLYDGDESWTFNMDGTGSFRWESDEDAKFTYNVKDSLVYINYDEERSATYVFKRNVYKISMRNEKKSTWIEYVKEGTENLDPPTVGDIIIVGSWEHETDDSYLCMTFNADGTGKFGSKDITFSADGKAIVIDGYDFKYSISGTKLRISQEHYSEDFTWRQDGHKVKTSSVDRKLVGTLERDDEKFIFRADGTYDHYRNGKNVTKQDVWDDYFDVYPEVKDLIGRYTIEGNVIYIVNHLWFNEYKVDDYTLGLLGDYEDYVYYKFSGSEGKEVSQVIDPDVVGAWKYDNETWVFRLDGTGYFDWGPNDALYEFDYKTEDGKLIINAPALRSYTHPYVIQGNTLYSYDAQEWAIYPFKFIGPAEFDDDHDQDDD